MHAFKFKCLLILIGWFLNASAQPGFNYPARLATISTGAWYRSWTITIDNQRYQISEQAYPLQINSPVTDQLSLIFSTSYANAILSQNTREQLPGLADGKIAAFYQIIPHHLLLNLGGSVPYGKNQFNAEQMTVAEILYENVLNFRYNRFGEGFDVDLGLATAFQAGRHFTFGLGTAYLRKGEYKYFETSDSKYKPADEISFNLGIDFQRDSLLVRFDWLGKLYTKTYLEGQPFFQQGNQTEFAGYCEMQFFPFTLNLALKEVLKQANEFYEPVTNFFLQGENFINNSFFSKAILYYQTSPSLALSALFGFDHFGDSDLQLGNARIFSSGIGLKQKFSEKILTDLQIQYLNGSALKGEMMLSGWDIQLMFHLRI